MGQGAIESGAAVSSDGRQTRAARTRASVVDALLTLNEQGNLRPTARDIAAQAGVSLRSLYVHFDDLEALFVAAGHRQAERLSQVLPPMVLEGDFPERFDAFMARRVTIHEFGAGVRRAALLQEPFSPVLQHTLGNARQALRAEVEACFRPELDATDTATRTRLLGALDIATSPAAWESLRTHQDLPVEEATAQVRAMVLAFITTWVPADVVGITPASTHAPASMPAPATRPPAGPQG
jgi:AcrR family transcriptional regulator